MFTNKSKISQVLNTGRNTFDSTDYSANKWTPTKGNSRNIVKNTLSIYKTDIPSNQCRAQHTRWQVKYNQQPGANPRPDVF